MTLSFPNQSRSYDAEAHRVRFWGYDSTFEVPFFLDENVLFALHPRTEKIETAILAAFDATRERIIEVATRMYQPRQRRSHYVLAAADF